MKKYLFIYTFVGWDRAIGMATRYELAFWDRNRVGAEFSATFLTDPAAHPTSCISGTGSVSWG